jgi:hypothetical protein
MSIRLFDVNNGIVIPTEHCFTITVLKEIMEAYPDDYLQIYEYIFYMTCPNPEMNPFFNLVEHEKEEMILSNIGVTGEGFTTEDDLVIKAIKLCQKLYETPTYRAYMGIKSMLDRLAYYMETTEIEHGRDGNINSMVNAAAKFEAIRQSFRGACKDLMEEQKGSVRGGQHLGYDQ